MRSVIARVLPDPAAARTEKFRSSSRAKRCRASRSTLSLTVRFLRFGSERRMSEDPFFAQEIDTYSERGQWVGTSKAKALMHSAEHSEDTAFLHVMERLPEIVLCQGVFEFELRFQIAGCRETGETRIFRTECVRCQGVERELDPLAVDELLPEPLFRGLTIFPDAPIESPLASRFVINNPNLGET